MRHTDLRQRKRVRFAPGSLSWTLGPFPLLVGLEKAPSSGAVFAINEAPHYAAVVHLGHPSVSLAVVACNEVRTSARFVATATEAIAGWHWQDSCRHCFSLPKVESKDSILGLVSNLGTSDRPEPGE